MVTKQTVMTLFNTPSAVRVGRQQLFIVTLLNNVTVLVSYLTVVGYLKGNVWYITDRKYNQTTSKQLTTFARNKRVHKLTEDDFNSQLQLLGVTK